MILIVIFTNSKRLNEFKNKRVLKKNNQNLNSINKIISALIIHLKVVQNFSDSLS